MTNKKLEFGIFSVEASVIYTDDVDIEEYFTRADWNALSATQQNNWILAHIEELATTELSINYKLNT